MAMTIRPATVADRAALVALGLRFAQGDVFKRWLAGADEATIGYAVEFMFRAGEKALVALAEEAGRPIGMLAVAEVPNAFTQVIWADELCWFVDQDRRGLRAGPALLANAEAWARGRGIGTIRMGAPFGTGVGRFLDRQGYTPFEASYAKVLL